MSSFTDDPKYWLDREAEARAIAEGMMKPETAMIMHHIADGYKQIAESTTRRRKIEEQIELLKASVT